MDGYLFIAFFVIFICAFIGVLFIVPVIIWVSFQKRLVTPVNKRSSHKSITPPFGGVAFYIIYVVLISIIQIIQNESIGYNIIAAISILFMIGLKDDLVHSTAIAKLTGQLAASLIVVYSKDFRISFHGFSENFSIHPFISILASVSLLILIINAYNLIDGIDGLAAMIGIVACSTYSWIFFINNELFFFLLSIMTIGILAAFLRFNLSKKNNKIFMGDCGSLIIGLIVGLLTLHFLAIPSKQQLIFSNIHTRILLTTAVFFVPFADTFRIIIVRVIKKRNPFKADRNHLHHILADFGLTHIYASLILNIINVCVLLIFFAISQMLNSAQMYACMATLYMIVIFIFYKLNITKNFYLYNN